MKYEIELNEEAIEDHLVADFTNSQYFYGVELVRLKSKDIQFIKKYKDGDGGMRISEIPCILTRDAYYLGILCLQLADKIKELEESYRRKCCCGWCEID